MNLNGKDLNLLYIFQILMEERHVSRAAKRLKLTQPAVSNALSRLRQEFQDPLLVRSRKGMSPTPLALQLWPRLKEFCGQATAIFADETFNLRTQETVFKISTTDFFELVFLNRILNHLQTHAPQMQLVMRPTYGTLPIQEMESGAIDFAAGGFFTEVPEGFHSAPLFDETYSCILRKDHPLLEKGSLNLQNYLQMEHILVTLHGDLLGVVDRILAKQNLKRKIVAGVMSFHSTLPLVASSDLVATVPTRIANMGVEPYQLICLPPPLKIPSFSVKLVWHARTHSSRPHIWMRESLREIIQSMTQESGGKS